MSHNTAISPAEEKPSYLHHDKADIASLNDANKVASDTVQLVSQDKYLSLWQTIKRYPRASAISALAAFGAVSDGYQYNLPGNIIALPGFIQQFGSPNAAGKYVIDPQHIALWSGMSTPPL